MNCCAQSKKRLYSASVSVKGNGLAGQGDLGGIYEYEAFSFYVSGSYVSGSKHEYSLEYWFRMAQAGTSLSDLYEGGAAAGGGQEDIVQKILADMSAPAMPQGQRPPPPPMPQQAPVYQQQMASSTMPMTMDSNIPTSHMIGNQHPTPADFAAAVTGVTGQRGAEQGLYAGGQMGPMMPGYGIPAMGAVASSQKNFYGKLVDELKVPFIVTLIVFVFSLPPIRVLVSHYLPSLIKSSGEFTVIGQVGVAAVAGVSFWVLQRIVAPLLF